MRGEKLSSFLIQLLAGGAGVISLMAYFFFKGKKSARNNQIKENIDNALKTQKARAERRNDSDDIIRKRMRSYVRK